MAQFGKTGLRGATDAGGGRVRADQGGETGLDSGVAAAQRVVAGVGDLRRVVGMIGSVVVGDGGGKVGEFGGGLGFGQGVDRGLRGLLGLEVVHTSNPCGGRWPRRRSSAAARAASEMISPANMRAISSRLASGDK